MKFTEENFGARVMENNPLILALTNHVTAQDVVNAILAAGGSAMCGEDAEEVEELAALADGLLLNTGVPSGRKTEAMLLAGKAANGKGIPVVLDPVGAGASQFRGKLLARLLEEVRFTCIRGNGAEIAALCNMAFVSRGVEGSGICPERDRIMELSERTGAVIVASGPVDRIAYRNERTEKYEEVSGGSSLFPYMTGAGCMLSGLLSAYLGACAQEDFDAICACLRDYKRHGEEAQKQMKLSSDQGMATFKRLLIDGISRRKVAKVI